MISHPEETASGRPAGAAVLAQSEKRQPLMRQILSVPNQLTMLRMLVLPFIFIAMFYREHTLALGLFAVAATTDAIDGIIARRFNQKTRLGAYLDPIADKLLLSSSFVAQSLIGTVPWWLTILVLGRDLMIVAAALVMVLATSIRDFPPSPYGKANTMVQVATLMCVVWNNAVGDAVTAEAAKILIWAAAGTTLVSAFHYAVDTTRRIQAHHDQA